MLIHSCDNVEVNLSDGHKYAVKDIAEGEYIIKYGFPIGHATKYIHKGEHVHSHNLKTNLGEVHKYTYTPEHPKTSEPTRIPVFNGYRRDNGEVGIRNDIWIINTVGCINKVVEAIAKETGAICFPHPFGCSQLGGDKQITEQTLCGLIKHPNAGGILILGLGCENSNLGEIKKMLGNTDTSRIRFLNCQDEPDEIQSGILSVKELMDIAKNDIRVEIPVSELKIGLKCGGSDGYSGITANPLVGRISDRLIACKGTSVLTEIPEMFGAETIYMNRAENKEVFEKIVAMVNNFKKYFIDHNQVVYENPSPGNKAGGITTLEEKSLGCIQKGGTSPVTDVLDYGERLKKRGLNLLNGPGNDIVACTNLTAAGCHMILFTTGRGTPLGAPVPTVKIASNRELALKKPDWIDFDASGMLEENDLTNDLFALCIEIASGKTTKNEIRGYREISIFKDGIIL